MYQVLTFVLQKMKKILSETHIYLKVYNHKREKKLCFLEALRKAKYLK